ncbi:MAG: ABC transporter permease [Firmicutes bacterium]|nr:ABC transporter permease [Bacillota bacterium]
MRALVKRNLLLFFRDRAAVFFSLLGVFVIIGLYLLFLGDVMKSDFRRIEGAGPLVDNWIMAGVIAVTPITTVMGALGNMIDDQRFKISKDFLSSPVKRSTLASGYIASSFIIGVVMTLFTIVLAEVYIVVNGGAPMNSSALGKVLAVVILNCLSATFMLFFVVSLFKSPSAYSTASTLIGTLIGFLTGIYIPVGSLPAPIQTLIKIFPPSHAAMLIRRIMMESAEAAAFAGAPASELLRFRLIMGVSFDLGGRVISWWESTLYLLCVGVVFFVLSVWKISRKQTSI